MSQNEVDQISRETGSTFRQILNAGHTYLASLRRRDRYAGVRKLTRSERKEMAEHIRVQVGEQRIAQAWFTHRAEDYRRESVLFRHRMAAGMDESTAGRANARLDAMRYSIESTLHNTVLPLEQRGQVVRQLDAFDFARDLDRPVTPGQLFEPMGSRDQMLTRDAAVRSEQWVTARRDEADHIVNHHARRDGSTPGNTLEAENAALRARVAELEGAQQVPGSAAQARQANPPTEAGTRAPQPMNWEQSEAVQGLRRAEVEAGRARSGEQPNQHAIAQRNAAYYNARSRGLSKEQIDWEIANVAANSRSQTTIAYQDRDGQVHRVHGYHASEAEAATWADRKLRTGDRAPNTPVRATSIERGHTRPYFSVEGDLTQAQDQARAWRTDTDNAGRTNTGRTSGQAAAHQDSGAGAVEPPPLAEATKEQLARGLAAEMLAAHADKDSALVQGKVADLNDRHGSDTAGAAAEFTQWWATEGGGEAYQAEKSTRTNSAGTTSGGTESAEAEPKSARTADAEHDQDQDDLVSKAKSTQRAARANRSNGNGARAKGTRTKPMNAFATAAAAENGTERDGAER